MKEQGHQLWPGVDVEVGVELLGVAVDGVAGEGQGASNLGFGHARKQSGQRSAQVWRQVAALFTDR